MDIIVPAPNLVASEGSLFSTVNRLITPSCEQFCLWKTWFSNMCRPIRACIQPREGAIVVQVQLTRFELSHLLRIVGVSKDCSNFKF